MENHQGELIDEPKEICETSQENFGQLFGWTWHWSDSRLDLKDFLIELSRLSERDMKNCDGSIAPEEMMDAMIDCGLDGGYP